MRIQIKCGTDERRLAVKDSGNINGIDYLELVAVNAPIGTIYRPLLLLFCFKEIVRVNKVNVRIEGGIRIKDIKIEWVKRADEITDEIISDLTNYEKNIIDNINEPKQKRILVIRPKSDGDFSTYTLRLIHSVDNQQLPPDNFDNLLSQVDFSFKVECPSEFDCIPQQQECPPEVMNEPVIDYMAKDFASFRRLMLDRMAAIMPDWKERNVADLGTVLVELFAYIGDHLSYYQDAVSTESYLGTARKRISIRRHARLLDYFMHDGCNARVWICIELDKDHDGLLEVPQGTKLLTGSVVIDNNNLILSEQQQFEEALLNGAEAFQTMHPIILYHAHNQMHFYTWGNSKCCLPQGATHATLKNENNKFDFYLLSWGNVPGNGNDRLKDFLIKNFNMSWVEGSIIDKPDDKTIRISDGIHSASIILNDEKNKANLIIEDGRILYEFFVKQEDSNLKIYTLSLKVGDVLLFEEIRSPTTGEQSDADKSHRHAVKIIEVKRNIDKLNNTSIVEIGWSRDDALPFPLCIDNKDLEKEEHQLVSIARGNVVLADHGYTFTQSLGNTPKKGNFSPQLSRKPLTHRGPFNPDLSAFSVFNYDPRESYPDITIEGEGKTWSAKRDLLASDKFASEFVVEMENDGSAQIRFGNNILGSKPQNSTDDKPNPFNAIYRVGNGRQGNIGAETITRIVSSATFSPEGITRIWNPMEARGGIDPEKNDDVRQYAPVAFLSQERAVTEQDYRDILKSHPEIQRAAATIRWTGSWYTVFVTIDRLGGKEIDDQFKEEILKFLNRYRLAVYDLEIDRPIYVPLDISMMVCVGSNYFRSEVKKSLLEIFSSRNLLNGLRGFFHPDNFSFGEPVFLSKIYTIAMKVQGVTSVNVERFQRWGKSENGELDAGIIEMGLSEIARLDNDPNIPENGKIEFIVEGGL
jgi:hypothetical protein